MVHLIELTEAEVQLLEAWVKLVEKGFRDKTLKQWDERAALELGISPVTVRTRRSRLKGKYEQALDLVARYRHYQQFYVQRTGGAFNPLSRSGRAIQKRRRRK